MSRPLPSLLEGTREGEDSVTCEAAGGLSQPIARGGVLRVLYVFSGAPREGDLEDWLKHLAEGRGVEVKAIDILRHSKQDLTKERLKNNIIEDVRNGWYYMVVASPPCSSFSRARYSGRPGPPALRSGEWLRGFPRLQGPNERKVMTANLLIDFVVALSEAQAVSGGLALVEHPEDLGSRRLGDPGSIWRWPSVRALEEKAGLQTGALMQSDWGRSYAKPTRFMYNLAGFEALVKNGWPDLDREGRYQGPLPENKLKIELIGKDGTDFNTLKAAAWPSPLCEKIAELI